VDQPDLDQNLPSSKALLLRFAPLALLLAGVGWVMEGAATQLVEATSLEHSTVGLFITSICTSLPELVTSVAAVRQGSLTLAVGGIIGGNAFDTLFTAVSDVAYREGSIYHHVDGELFFWVLLTILMTAVLMVGLIRRQKNGVGRVGVETITIVVLYFFGVATTMISV
jgi:cation:H+ antiporter